MSALILYATETGTAQAVADRIALECRRIHFQARVSDISAYPAPTLISEPLIIFVVSTTASGVEPRSMMPLWSLLLRADLPEDLFDETLFTVFGLGDSAYEKFCWPAKKLARRMVGLGAGEICERGEGDEQHPLGIDGALDPWIEKLLDVLLQLHPLPDGLEVIPADALPAPRVSILDAPPSHAPESADSESPPLEATVYHTARLKSSTRITPSDWFQDVRHLEFEFDDDIRYEPGDLAVIHPSADNHIVESLINTIGWGNIADDPILVRQTCADQTVPALPSSSPTTLRALLTRTVDIAAVPRRSFFQLLRHFTADKLEEETLAEFISAEGADLLYEYAQRPRRTIHETLTEFRSARIPREYIFDLFPPLRPRQFSIASTIARHPHQVHLCVAIVRYRTRLKVPRTGVCTSFLSGLQPGDKIRLGIQKGLIRLPPDPATPIICVGPGTGIAPMRAVIEARVDAGAKDTTLYFGCRSSGKDQHYGAEWRGYEARGELTYRVAFSRDGKEGEKRTYVQDVMKDECAPGKNGPREEGQRVWRVLSGGGWVFISGSSNKMPAGVKDALVWAVHKYGGKEEVDAKEYVRRLESEGRIYEECWS